MRGTLWLALLLPAAAWAGEPALTDAEARTAAILAALDLPKRAQALRDLGVPVEEVSQALTTQRDHGVPASEAEETMQRAEEDVKEHGHVDNFGDFVQSKLDEGLRGQDLAAAIRAEHEAHGKGKPEHAGDPDDDDDDDHDDHDDHGASGDHGRPEGGGKPEDAGKPADAGHGKPESKGGAR